MGLRAWTEKVRAPTALDNWGFHSSGVMTRSSSIPSSTHQTVQLHSTFLLSPLARFSSCASTCRSCEVAPLLVARFSRLQIEQPEVTHFVARSLLFSFAARSRLVLFCCGLSSQKCSILIVHDWHQQSLYSDWH